MEETETIDKADDFTDAAESESTRGSFVVDLDGYEGPIDVLLTLAREHKLDLTKISIRRWPISTLNLSPRCGGRIWNWLLITW